MAWIDVKGARVPVKRIAFRPGRPLAPPASNRVAGVSTWHAPLGAASGTTVITWHVRYGTGCPGALNPLLHLPIGGTFTVEQRSGKTTRYRITDRTEVPKGRYRAAWFRTDGPPRLALFTCGGLRGGVFRSNIAIFAQPVSPGERS